jgi:hypothetical protein
VMSNNYVTDPVRVHTMNEGELDGAATQAAALVLVAFFVAVAAGT